MTLKAGFFEKTNKIDKPLARVIKKKRERAQINKISSKKLQLTPQKYKGLLQITISNYMPVKQTTQKK